MSNEYLNTHYNSHKLKVNKEKNLQFEQLKYELFRKMKQNDNLKKLEIILKNKKLNNNEILTQIKQLIEKSILNDKLNLIGGSKYKVCSEKTKEQCLIPCEPSKSECKLTLKTTDFEFFKKKILNEIVNKGLKSYLFEENYYFKLDLNLNKDIVLFEYFKDLESYFIKKNFFFEDFNFFDINIKYDKIMITNDVNDDDGDDGDDDDVDVDVDVDVGDGNNCILDEKIRNITVKFTKTNKIFRRKNKIKELTERDFNNIKKYIFKLNNCNKVCLLNDEIKNITKIDTDKESKITKYFNMDLSISAAVDVSISDEISKLFFEKQTYTLLCGIHSINNLFQKHIYRWGELNRQEDDKDAKEIIKKENQDFESSISKTTETAKNCAYCNKTNIKNEYTVDNKKFYLCDDHKNLIPQCLYKHFPPCNTTFTSMPQMHCENHKSYIDDNQPSKEDYQRHLVLEREGNLTAEQLEILIKDLGKEYKALWKQTDDSNIIEIIKEIQTNSNVKGIIVGNGRHYMSILVKDANNIYLLNSTDDVSKKNIIEINTILKKQTLFFIIYETTSAPVSAPAPPPVSAPAPAPPVSAPAPVSELPEISTLKITTGGGSSNKNVNLLNLLL